MHHLLEWVQNGHADKYVKDVLQHPQPHESPAYWPAVSVTLNCNHVERKIRISDWFTVQLIFFCNKILKYDQVDVQLHLYNPRLVIGRLL